MDRCVFAPASPAAIVKAAVARSNVDVYAGVDVCVSYNNDGNPDDKSGSGEGGRQSGGRIDFKAREEAGAGMAVSYALKINAHTGAIAQSHSTTSRLYGRQAWGVPGACYLYRPTTAQFACHEANTVAGPTASGAVTGKERAAFFGAIYDFGAGKAHIVYADKKLPTIKGDGKDCNDLVDVSAAAGAAGKVMASETRNQVRNMSSGDFDRYAIGYTYLLPICTNLYTSYSYLKNEDDFALATYNDSVHGANGKRFNVGMHHMC